MRKLFSRLASIDYGEFARDVLREAFPKIYWQRMAIGPSIVAIGLAIFVPIGALAP